MSKTILFPTDFSILSLKMVQTAIQDHPGEKLDLVLIHGIHLSDSIAELLFFSRSAVIKELSNEGFENACFLLNNLFSKSINSLRTELFTGFTQSAFQAFLTGLHADKIYVPVKLQLEHKMSMELSGFIAKSKIEKVIQTAESAQESRQSGLFSHINFAK